MSTYLANLTNLPGVEGAVLCGPDGLSLESYGHYTEFLAAELSALKHLFERSSRVGGIGGISRVSLTAETLEVVAVASGPYVAALALSRGTDTRTAQQALAKVALDLSLPGAGYAR